MCACVRVRVCMCVRVQSVGTYICIYMYVCIYMYTCGYVSYTYVYMYVCVNVITDTYVCIYINCLCIGVYQFLVMPTSDEADTHIYIYSL